MAWPAGLLLVRGGQRVWGHLTPRPPRRSGAELAAATISVAALAAWVATWAPTGPPTLALVLLHTLWIAPAEEWFFRGELQGRLRGLIGPSWAIGVAALAFGLSHLVITRSAMGLATVAPGLLLGAVRERQGSIAGAVLLHAVANVSLMAWSGAFAGAPA